jgi:enamine deaminase RidA (YjgF/YER057c/UK114 family)
LSRIERALTALGATLADVVRTGVYLAPGASWEQAASAHHDVFADIRPANTMLYVAELIGDGFLVEIEAQAVVSS